jgi:hypothetical protein
VSKDEDGYYYLRSSAFDQMTNSDAVRERALELLGYMNGSVKLRSGGSYRAVGFDVVTQIDESGNRHHHITLSSTIEARSRVTAKLTVGDHDVTEDASQPPSEVAALANLADQNEKIADALRFYERGDWINLYKAWEVVCDAAGGSHEVVNKGWAAERDRSRFTGTAQSRTELGDEARHAGDEARHASDKYQAPKDPMTLDEARSFVKSVILAWVGTL